MPKLRQHFNNITELLEFYKPMRGKIPPSFLGERSEDTYEGVDGVRLLTEGSARYLKDIQRYIDEAWESIPNLQRTWSLFVAGAFPCVPAFLAGEPESMWIESTELSDRTPIRIWIGTTSSWCITEMQLAKRGAVLTAFAQALSQIRPVFLTPYTSYGSYRRPGNDCVISWDLQTSPLVMSEVAASLCEISVVRHFTRHIAEHVNPIYYDGGWAEGFDDLKVLPKILGAGDSDLCLPSLISTDPLLKDPIKWIHDQLQKYTTNQEEMIIR